VFLVRSVLVAMLVIVSLFGRASAQLARLDSLTLRAASTVLGRVQDAQITFDSALHPLGSLLIPATSGTARALKLSTISATLDTSAVPATLDIDLVAASSVAPRETRQWSTTEHIELLPEDRLAIETHRLRFVTLRETPHEGSLWSDVLEPVVVVLAAGAIVALFFLIRS
jgi:hypothetical protein